MPEQFKIFFNTALIDKLAAHLARVSPGFDAKAFVTFATNNLDALEMMARADQISKALDLAFAEEFVDNLQSMTKILHPTKTADLADMQTDDDGIAGWPIVPLASYVARNGMAFPEESLAALRQMTMRFSTEFAVRYFLRDQPKITLQTFHNWSRDPNHHVRRLSSEGIRPLLPWGIKLHRYVDDPSDILPILERLRDDPSAYVRKSVANNLNDISKDHPDLVADLAKSWLRGAPKSRQHLVKHACRTLIKSGHAGALSAFGFGPPDLSSVHLAIPREVQLGDKMPISLEIKAGQNQNLLIDYVLHFMRANGKLSAKVFKWCEIEMKHGERRTLIKTHPYRKVTTRKDYPGQQELSVQINGVEVARAPFELSI